tara:strand:+ start:2065 stop:2334 length:270 start_codon:yes stop_codon:yes gene_type:complete
MQEMENRKLIIGLYAIFLGGFGVHKFLMGKDYKNAAIIMLCISTIGGVITCGVSTTAIFIISIIEAIIYITKSPEDFKKTYVDNTKAWF